MPVVRLAASALVTLLIFVLCAILLPPAFEMQALGPTGGLGAGALPQFVVVAVPLLALASLASDILAYRRQHDRSGTAAGADAAEHEPWRVVVIGSAVLGLLAVYAAAWRYIGFPAASIGFMAVLALVLMPRHDRTRRGLLVLLATSVLFCIGVWALFVHVLMVPLR